MTARRSYAAAVALLLISTACRKSEAPAQAPVAAQEPATPKAPAAAPPAAAREPENPLLLDDREFEVQVGIDDGRSSKALATWLVDTLRAQGYRVNAEPSIGSLPDPKRSRMLFLVNLLELSAGCRVSVEGTRVDDEQKGEMVFAWGSEDSTGTCQGELKKAVVQFIAKVPPMNPPKSR